MHRPQRITLRHNARKDRKHRLTLVTLMHDCMRLSGIFFMLAMGGGSAEMKHLTHDAKRGTGRRREGQITPHSP